MADRGYIYDFEGIGEDLPRPPMAALRALLAAGVVVSARTWQELDRETRRGLAQAGAEDVLNDAVVADLVRRIPVAHVKLVGKRSDPDPRVVPTDLVIALGPARPLTNAEWAGMRVLDRHVVMCLVKNTRLLAKALQEILPGKGGLAASNVWSGAVARSELRVRKEVLHRVLSVDFYDGNAFTLANVAGRRAARRASEVLDQRADATVGPVEIDWGLRSTDDVLFWQAHVSDWDGTFFPAAALLATTTAAAAMFDLVKDLDAGASIIFSGVREEPWQAGRQETHDAPTAFYKPGAQPQRVSLRDTIHDNPPHDNPPRDNPPRDNPPSAQASASVPPPPRPSGPSLAGASLGGGPASYPSLRGARPPTSSGVDSIERAEPSRGAPARPAWLGTVLVSALVLANLVVIFAIVSILTRHH